MLKQYHTFVIQVDMSTIWPYIFEWYGVRCESKSSHQQACSNYVNHSRLNRVNIMVVVGNLYKHLRSRRVLTFDNEQKIIWALKVISQMAMGTIRIHLPSCTDCVFHISTRNRCREKSIQIIHVYLNVA